MTPLGTNACVIDASSGSLEAQNAGSPGLSGPSQGQVSAA